MMVGMAMSLDDSRALLDVLHVLHTDPAFQNLVQLLCPAWFAGVLCHTKKATALETALRTAGDGAADGDDDDDGNARSVALQAELDAAAENDNEDAAEAVAALLLFPLPAPTSKQRAAAAARAPAASWPPRGPA